MIDFLPQEAKIAVRREYRVRLFVVCAFLYAVALFTGATLLAPAYLSLVYEIDALTAQDARSEAKAETEVYERARTELAEAEMLVFHLSVSEPTPTLFALVREIQKTAAQTDALAITGISYERPVTLGADETVAVQGTAATRETLTWFTAALERGALVTRADIPLSALAAERNLPFTITLTLTPQTPP